MLQTIAMLFDLIDRQTRRGLVGLAAGMLAAMVLEMAGLGLFLPLFQLMLDPERAMGIPFVADLRATVAGGDITRLILLVAVGMLVLFVIKAGALAFITFHQNRFVAERQATFARDMLSVYLGRPYLYHVQSNTAALVRDVTVLSARVFVKGLLPLLHMVAELLTVAGLMAVLLLVDAVSTLAVGGALVIVLAGFYGMWRRSLYRWGERTVALDKTVLQTVNQALGAVKPIKVGGLQDFFVDAFARPVTERARYIALGTTVPLLPRLFLEVVAVAGLVCMLAVVAWRGGSVSEVLPTLGIFAVAVARLMPSFSRIVSNLGVLKESTSSIRTLHASLKTAPSLAAAAPAPAVVARNPAPIGRLEVVDVGFRYPGADHPALAGISFAARQGESVALVGRSGAGKTSLADVLLGLIEPTAGQVLLDGVDYRADLSGWQRRIGYVPQDVYLIDDTLRRNIALGVPDDAIDEAALARALADACLDAAVARLPAGLDTMVGERGARLSGGQRQRVGIARALYHDPDVLVLDEATSALDNETERDIIDAINRLHGAKTLIVIAHRLSTVRRCDRLVFLDQGRVADIGTFDELVARNEDFRRMAVLDSVGGDAS